MNVTFSSILSSSVLLAAVVLCFLRLPPAGSIVNEYLNRPHCRSKLICRTFCKLIDRSHPAKTRLYETRNTRCKSLTWMDSCTIYVTGVRKMSTVLVLDQGLCVCNTSGLLKNDQNNIHCVGCIGPVLGQSHHTLDISITASK